MLKANQATTYTKTEVDSNLTLKQNKVIFPSSEGSTGWGVIVGSTNTVRRLVGAQPVRTFELDLDNSSSINDVQIGLDMDLTGVTNYYTKTEMDNKLVLKANQSTKYTNTEVDSILELQANQAATYSKTEVDNKLVLKATQSTTNTKTEVDINLALKANQAKLIVIWH